MADSSDYSLQGIFSIPNPFLLLPSPLPPPSSSLFLLLLFSLSLPLLCPLSLSASPLAAGSQRRCGSEPAGSQEHLKEGQRMIGTELLQISQTLVVFFKGCVVLWFVCLFNELPLNDYKTLSAHYYLEMEESWPSIIV